MHNLVDEYVYCSPFRPVASLDEELNGTGGDPEGFSFDIADPTSDPERDCELTEVRDSLRRFVKGLTERERQIVADVFWFGKTQAAVARDSGVSGAAVSKTLQRVLAAGRVNLALYRDCCLMN